MKKKISEKHKKLVHDIAGFIISNCEEDVKISIVDKDGSVSFVLMFPECE